MSDRPSDDLDGAIEAYQAKFSDLPTIWGLPDMTKAAELLRRAVADDAPFKDDATWFEALRLEPPEDDVVI